MKTIITVNHTTRRDLKHALTLIQAELSLGYIAASSSVPATAPPIMAQAPTIMAQAPTAAYPSGFPGPLLTAKPQRREDDTPAESEELEPTRYSYKVED